jgi:hypothetical protein
MANIASAASSIRNTNICAVISLPPALTHFVATLQPAVARFVYRYDIVCNVGPYAS